MPADGRARPEAYSHDLERTAQSSCHSAWLLGAVNSHAGQRDSIKRAPKSGRSSRAVVPSTRESVDWPTFGAFATSRPTCTNTCSCTLTKNCIPCLYYATSSHAVCKADAPFIDHHHSRQQHSTGHSLLCKVRLKSPSPRPEVSCKRACPGQPDSQVKYRLHASLPLRRDKSSKGR